MVKTTEIGYINLNKDTPIPETIQDIRLRTAHGGPINLAVMKPFRSWQSAVSLLPDEKDGANATLRSYVGILRQALQCVGGNKRSRFVLYVNMILDHSNYLMIGKVYKL